MIVCDWPAHFRKPSAQAPTRCSGKQIAFRCVQTPQGVYKGAQIGEIVLRCSTHSKLAFIRKEYKPVWEQVVDQSVIDAAVETEIAAQTLLSLAGEDR